MVRKIPGSTSSASLDSIHDTAPAASAAADTGRAHPPTARPSSVAVPAQLSGLAAASRRAGEQQAAEAPASVHGTGGAASGDVRPGVRMTRPMLHAAARALAQESAHGLRGGDVSRAPDAGVRDPAAGLLSDTVDPFEYGGEFNYVGPKRAAELGCEITDPRMRTHVMSRRAQAANTLVFDRTGRARLAGGQAIAGPELGFVLDPKRAEFVGFSNTMYRVSRLPDGSRSREPVTEAVGPEYWNHYPGSLLELPQHSSALGVDPVIKNGEPQRDASGETFLQPRAAGMAGYFGFDTARRLRKIDDLSGHYKPSPAAMLQALEILARKGALFEHAVSDPSGERDELERMIHDAVAENIERVCASQETLSRTMQQWNRAEDKDKPAIGEAIMRMQAQLRPYERALAYLVERDIRPTFAFSSAIQVEVFEPNEALSGSVERFMREPALPSQLGLKARVLDELRQHRPPQAVTHEGSGTVDWTPPASDRQKLHLYLDLLAWTPDSLAALEHSLLRSASTLFARRQPEKALERLATALSIEPGPVTLASTGRANVRALAALSDTVRNEAGAVAPNLWQAAFHELDDLRRAGRHADAAQAIARIVQTYQDRQASLGDSAFYRDLPSAGNSATWLLEAAKTQQALGQAQAALASADRALATLQAAGMPPPPAGRYNPSHTALLVMASAFLTLGRLDQAAQSARATLNGTPPSLAQHGQALLLMSTVRTRRGDVANAETLCLQSIKHLLTAVVGERSDASRIPAEFRDNLKQAVEQMASLRAARAAPSTASAT